MSTACTCSNDKCLLTKEDPRHNSQNGYANYYCRCEGCRNGAKEAARASRQKKRNKSRVHRSVRLSKGQGMCPCWNKDCRLTLDSDRHGSISGYATNKCRCTLCSAAKAIADAEYRRRREERLRKELAEVTKPEVSAEAWEIIEILDEGEQAFATSEPFGPDEKNPEVVEGNYLVLGDEAWERLTFLAELNERDWASTLDIILRKFCGEKSPELQTL